MSGPSIGALLIVTFVGASYGQFLGAEQRDSIVSKHNSLRAQPFSGFYGSNMVEVNWDDALATLAQTWATALCATGTLSNQNLESLTVPGLNGVIGQNIGMYAQAGSAVDVSQALDSVIQLWYNENQTVSLDEINPFSEEAAAKAGHFTQVVWALTHRIGCGACVTLPDPLTNLQKCFVVCDYFKAGNVLGQNQNTFKAGEQLGTNCPPGTAQDGNNGLCKIYDEAMFNEYAG